LRYPLLKTLVFTLLFSLPYGVSAQLPFDTVTHLREVVVEQSRLGSYAISKYTLKVDSLTHQLAGASSLADLMRKYGYGHLRGYGPGGLATASFRGTGSSHTAVLWNGINLTSPLSGQVDLSHIPVSFIDDISMQTGGAASLYGSGSIGATIRLNSQTSFNEGLALASRASVGSFGNYYQDLGAKWSGSRFITDTRVFISQTDNDFPFLNNSITPTRRERRDHTAVDQKGLLHQNYWQAAPGHLLLFKFWYQDDAYEVPNATTIFRPTAAVEKNTFYRTVLGYHFTHDWVDLNYQGAYVRHDLGYADSLAQIPTDSRSRFNTLIQTLEGNFNLGTGASLTSGVNYTWEEGVVDDFGGMTPRRNRVAFFSALKWQPGTRWEVAAALREELVNGGATPLAPSLTVRLKAAPAWEVYASASRNYRIPTFNDLYWRGAGALGNPDLKAETSWSQEVGMQYTKPADDWSLTFKTAAFSNSVDDWVLWSPVSATTWSPLNLKNVWSRGVEAQASAGTAIGHTRAELKMQYVYTRATNQEIYDSQSSEELDKQLTFTPQHEGSVTARACWRKYTVNAVTSYTGKQYTDGDNNVYHVVKPYTLASLWLSRSLTWKYLHASLTGEVNNLFDTPYQSRPGYPMPGRNYKLILSVKFNKSKSS